MSDQSTVQFRPRSECAYDVAALGEVMLRLDPGVNRIHSASTFHVHEGGGEYNVASAPSSCFGLRAAVVTSLVNNEVGHLVDGVMRSSGVDGSWRRWLPFDGVGRAARNPLNFTERGFGVRSPLGVSDRGHSATSLLQPGEIDWEHLFGELGVRCLHTGGIFTALSVSTAAVAEEAMAAAHKYDTKVSYDLNYRPNLWQEAGGPRAAAELNERLLPMVDILIGVQAPAPSLPRAEFTEAIAELAARYPDMACIVATRRSGFLYGLLEGFELTTALNYGTAHGALVMTTPGDRSSAWLPEVRDLAETGPRAFVR